MKTLRERFEAKFQRGAESECWLWTAAVRHGYGAIWEGRRGGKMLLAHRLAYELYTGREIPEGIYICHACDTPACVNPSHLVAGSAAWNMADMVAKGRHVTLKGEALPQTKLTEDEVLEIRAAPGLQREIAKRFGVSRQLVGYIKLRQIWSHLK